MPYLIISTTDARFHSRDDGFQYSSMGAARSAAISAAAEIAIDSVERGAPSAVVEARLERADGTIAHRMAIALSVAQLQAH